MGRRTVRVQQLTSHAWLTRRETWREWLRRVVFR